MTCTSLEFENIVSLQRTFVNCQNTTIAILSDYIFVQISQSISVHHQHAFLQDLPDNGNTGLGAEAALLYHDEESQWVLLIGDEAGKQGIGLLAAANLRRSGFGANRQPGEVIRAVLDLHIVLHIFPQKPCRFPGQPGSGDRTGG